MFPSRYSFNNFGCKLPSGTLVEPATVLEYKEWRKTVSLDKQEAVREALGIRSLSQMRKEAFAAKDRLMQRDDLLSQNDAEDSSNENKARAQLVSSSSSSSSAMEHDSDQPNSSDDEDEGVLAAVIVPHASAANNNKFKFKMNLVVLLSAFAKKGGG